MTSLAVKPVPPDVRIRSQFCEYFINSVFIESTSSGMIAYAAISKRSGN